MCGKVMEGVELCGIEWGVVERLRQRSEVAGMDGKRHGWKEYGVESVMVAA